MEITKQLNINSYTAAFNHIDQTHNVSINSFYLKMSELVEVLDVPVPPVSTNITVKFKLHQFQTIAQVYPNHLKLDAIKEDLAGKFKVPAKYLHLLQDGISLSDSVRLSEMPHNNFYIVEMDLELNSEAHKLNENVKSHEKLIALNADVFYRFVEIL